jgi:CxxC motif-containing protein (DUF1111 family)
MKKLYVIAGITVLVASFSMCNKSTAFSESGYDERLSGGAATVFDATSNAFSNAVTGLSTRDSRVHDLGDQTFAQTFVAPPSPIFTGLGPIFNNISCVTKEFLLQVFQIPVCYFASASKALMRMAAPLQLQVLACRSRTRLFSAHNPKQA